MTRFDSWRPCMANVRFGIQMLLWGWACEGHDDLALFAAEQPELGKNYGWWDGAETIRRVPDNCVVTPGMVSLVDTQLSRRTRSGKVDLRGRR